MNPVKESTILECLADTTHDVYPKVLILLFTGNTNQVWINNQESERRFIEDLVTCLAKSIEDDKPQKIAIGYGRKTKEQLDVFLDNGRCVDELTTVIIHHRTFLGFRLCVLPKDTDEDDEPWRESL